MNVAIIDLGSNGFKLEIWSIAAGKSPDRVVSTKVAVRFLKGVSESGELDAATESKAIGVLKDFRKEMRGTGVDAVIAIATEGFRRVREAAEFLARAEAVLGAPIRILAGSEEATICFDGVIDLVGEPKGTRLVVDIGGGSTQFAYGTNDGLAASDTVRVGCVAWTIKHFANGRFDERNFERALDAARTAYMAMDAQIGMTAHEMVGASGAFRTVLEASTDGEKSTGILTRDAVDLVIARLREQPEASIETVFPNVSVDRVPIFVACTALVAATMDAVRRRNLVVCRSGLRRGLLRRAMREAALA